MIEPNPAHDRRQRRLLVGLAMLFFAPLGLAFYLYYGSAAWHPRGHVNHGDLIDPARPLPEVSLPVVRRDGTGAFSDRGLLKGKWTLLYVGDGACSDVCRSDLYNTRQVRFALNREMDRVQRIFLARGDCCDWTYLDADQPDLTVLRATSDAAPLIGLLPAIDGIPALSSDRVYIIDPLGNLMMSFAPDAKAKGMLTDLKRLLGLSQVG